MRFSKLILPVIVVSQFCCTSLWFAGNGVIQDLVVDFGLNKSALGHLISAVQFGFIIGTLIFAILMISDRFSPSKVFVVCALLGAVFNVGLIWQGNRLESILVLRFFTGFFLAGIYPVGMKIASDYYEKGLGRSLGFLVGALVLGTAFPHLLKDITRAFSWKTVLVLTSFIAILGGVLMVSMVPDGPYRKSSQKLRLSAFFAVFKNTNFRSAAFGYFGHMWELYAFWVFAPTMLKAYSKTHSEVMFNMPLLAFLIIAIGSLGSVFGGYLAELLGTKRTATIALFLSCICCLISPIIFAQDSEVVFVAFLFFWGIVVIADSPLFSTLVAQNVSREIKGTALTIVNCIGFAITIVSIQLVNSARILTDSNSIYTVLALGPILGLIALVKKRNLNI